MKAVKLASTEQDRIRLRSKCKSLLGRAEEIKKLDVWIPKSTKNTLLKAPASKRAFSTAEKILLLEGSRLHGFVFPPWEAEPDDSVFDDGTLYT